MGVFQILFLVLTIALPGYFFTRSTSAPGPRAEWGVWERAMARLIDSDGGFPECSTLELVTQLEDLCEASRIKDAPGNSVTFERSSPEITFGCEVHGGNIRVGWRLNAAKDGELKCKDPGGAIVPKAPGFNFTMTGLMRSMEFLAEDGSRQILPARNCRLKVAAAKKITQPPHELDQFFVQLGRSAGDPADYINGNFMCFVFDLSPLWTPWRERYRR